MGPSLARGAAGQLPGRRTPRPGFVAWGAGLRRGGLEVPALRQEDVASTLSALLDVPIGESDGVPAIGLLLIEIPGVLR